MNIEKTELPAIVAAPAAALYGLAVRARLLLHRWKWLPSHQLRQPVISVGNITAGGTGKTPIVEGLARLIENKGFNASILSRGYRRKGRGTLAVSRGQGPLTDASSCGDEPFLLARNLPGSWITVGEDRFAAGKLVERQLTRCIHLLDDGYQHLRLGRDLNILLLDATAPFGGEHLLPWGRLREPLSAIARADLIVITRADHPFEERTLVRRIKRINLRAPIVYAYNEVEGLVDPNTRQMHPARDFFRRQVAAFAGVANPQIFFDDLAHHQIEVIVRRQFSDHHLYTQEEIERLMTEARQAGAEALITTEKDEINMQGLRLDGLPIFYLRIRARFSEDDQMDFYLQEILT